MVNFLQLVVLGLLAGGVYVAVGVGFGVAGFVALVVGKPSERARRRRLGAPA